MACRSELGVWSLVFCAVGACADVDPAAAPVESDFTPVSALIAPPEPAASDTDPGTGPWVEVPAERVREECGLDARALARADLSLGAPYAVIRHGRLCHSFGLRGMPPEDALSATKTLGGVIAGMIGYQTRDLPERGPKTGPLRDTDRVDHWIDSFDYNRDALIGHVLGMVAPSPDLSAGRRRMVYDAFAIYIDSLSPLLNAAIRQDAPRLGQDLDQFTHRFLFEPLGMTDSTWGDGGPDKTFAFTWTTTVLDMARFGLLMLHGGVWDGQRLLDAEWIYRMTHPTFEDANTGWGYMTWLNAASNFHFDGMPLRPPGWEGVLQEPRLPGRCAPVALSAKHPHGLSDVADCNYVAPYTCAQAHDDGVWQALGLFGQIIQGHPGLDMVLVGKNLTGLGDVSGVTASAKLWDAIRPAVILADPTYAGDEEAFCRDYGRGDYAPSF